MDQKNNGKLSPKLLKKIIFSNIGKKRDEVLTQPNLGQDCGYFTVDDDIVCITTDPITATSEDIGSLAVIINLNDIAAAMAQPFAITVTVLMPSSGTTQQVEKIAQDISKMCEKHKVQVIGGHTEFTDAVNQPLLSITALGKISKKRYQSLGKVKEGSQIYVTKSLGLEGSFIIAKEKTQDLLKVLTVQELQEAYSYIDKLSVTKDSNLVKNMEICAMHDITEGGLLGALDELSENSLYSFSIDESLVPITDVTKKICSHFGINPLGLISSGSMLIVSNETLPSKIEDVDYTLIGRVEKKEKFLSEHHESSIVTDELYKVL